MIIVRSSLSGSPSDLSPGARNDIQSPEASYGKDKYEYRSESSVSESRMVMEQFPSSLLFCRQYTVLQSLRCYECLSWALPRALIQPPAAMCGSYSVANGITLLFRNLFVRSTMFLTEAGFPRGLFFRVPPAFFCSSFWLYYNKCAWNCQHDFVHLIKYSHFSFEIV